MAGYRVVLVVNSAGFHRDAGALDTPASMVIIRENIGFDFGAWSYAVNLIGGLERVRSVTFTNDSLLPLFTPALAATRARANEAPEDVLFLTASAQEKPHMQSFFFTLKQPALRANVLSLLAETPIYATKDALIHGEELHLSDRFAAAGHRPGALYPCRAAEASGVNPTIDHWQDLLELGFPFLKVQLFSLGRLAPDAPEVAALLPAALSDALTRHLAGRVESAGPRVCDPNQPRSPLSIFLGASQIMVCSNRGTYPLPPRPRWSYPLRGLCPPPRVKCWRWCTVSTSTLPKPFWPAWPIRRWRQPGRSSSLP